MSQEAAADGQWSVYTSLQVLEEVLAVEVAELLQVPEDDATLASQILWQLQSLHLRKIVLDDVRKGTHVFSLGGNHLIHNVLDFAARDNAKKQIKEQSYIIMI